MVLRKSFYIRWSAGRSPRVHEVNPVRDPSESLPLLMPQLLCYVLEQLGFPKEPRLEMRVRCPLVMSVELVMTMPVSFHIRPQD